MLAPWAAKARFSRGRAYPEKEDLLRTAYQRDRGRIIHSTAFRRLEYKTQVFVNHEGDYYRTRLTHTLEVAQIATSIARTLKLNEDLVEAIALAHDLGHTPFGHSGEEALRELMKGHGGFEHNRQGLRVVDVLECRYPDFPGLNLTWETREGIIKHSTPFDRGQLKGFSRYKFPSLEAQIVDVADEIAYNNHDLDDGLTSGLLQDKQLSRLKLWAMAKREFSRRHPYTKKEIKKYQIIRALINIQAQDVIRESEKRLREFKIKTQADARNAPQKAIGFSRGMNAKNRQLRLFLQKRLYRHYKVVRMADKAKRFIRELFNAYLNNPGQLPSTSRGRLRLESPQRVICDYIAGMTDRYVHEEYKKFFQPYARV